MRPLRLFLRLCAALSVLLCATLLGFLFAGSLGAGQVRGCFSALLCSLGVCAFAIAVCLPICILCAWRLHGRPGGAGALVLRTAACLPSVLYALLGLGLFVRRLGLGWSLTSGALTLCLMTLPPLAEGCLAVFDELPPCVHQAALALGLDETSEFLVQLRLGASALTARTLLLLGRLLGESAALLLTAGTVLGLPRSVLRSGRTLSVHILLLVQEQGDLSAACLASVLLLTAVLVPTAAANFFKKD